MKPTSPNTHQECRSLLQKAVRLGNSKLAAQVAEHLFSIDDRSWLYGRTAVILFEECWPLGCAFPPERFDLGLAQELLVNAAQSRKAKDAAGLGSLGFALSEGDESVIEFSGSAEDVRIIAGAVERPGDFWAWIKEESQESGSEAAVLAAERAYRRGSWPWDKAFIQAGAYLALTEGVPDVKPSNLSSQANPYLLAIDKHTEKGRAAIRDVAKSLGIKSRVMGWVSFYFGSATFNDLSPSKWWDIEIDWRFSGLGMQREQAGKIWESALPLLQEHLGRDSRTLEEHIGGDVPEKDVSFQESFLD